jgi:hypothetical protein
VPGGLTELVRKLVASCVVRTPFVPAGRLAGDTTCGPAYFERVPRSDPSHAGCLTLVVRHADVAICNLLPKPEERVPSVVAWAKVDARSRSTRRHISVRLVAGGGVQLDISLVRHLAFMGREVLVKRTRRNAQQVFY